MLWHTLSGICMSVRNLEQDTESHYVWSRLMSEFQQCVRNCNYVGICCMNSLQLMSGFKHCVRNCNYVTICMHYNIIYLVRHLYVCQELGTRH